MYHVEKKIEMMHVSLYLWEAALTFTTDDYITLHVAYLSDLSN